MGELGRKLSLIIKWTSFKRLLEAPAALSKIKKLIKQKLRKPVCKNLTISRDRRMQQVFYIFFSTDIYVYKS